MSRTAALWVILGLICTGPAQANNEAIAAGDRPDWARQSELLEVPDDADGIAFWRRQNVAIHLDDAGEQQFVSSRVRILDAAALELGNISIVWKPSAGAPVIHALAVHRAGDPVRQIDVAQFDIVRQEDQLEQAMLHGLLTASLRVPDLRVGDELEVSYSIPAVDPTLRDRSSGLLFFSGQMAMGRYAMDLSWEDGQRPRTRLSPDFADAAVSGDRRITIQMDNPDVLSPPADAPPRYGWQRIMQYSDFADWAAISRLMNGLFVEAATLSANSPVKAEAARIARLHASDADRAAAALDLVQEQVRYVFVGLNAGNLTPATAEETWERRFGDCKGKTALLLALLAELDIEAHAVLANNAGNDDGLDERLPLTAMFDHVLVRAEIDGQTRWLDGTFPAIAGPTADPLIPYRWVLPLSPGGAALERVSERPLTTPTEVSIYDLDASAGFDKPGIITVTQVGRGLDALQQQVGVTAMGKRQFVAQMKQTLLSGGQFDTVDEVDFEFRPDSLTSILSFSGTGPVSWDDLEEDYADMVLPGGGTSPPARHVRPPEQDASAPFYNTMRYACSVTTVRIPDATRMQDWGANSGYDTMLFGVAYYRRFDLRDRSIRLVRSSLTVDQEVAPDRAARDNDRIEAFDNSMGRIWWRPGSGGDSFDPDWPEVPTAGDIDWAGERVPCAAPDLVERGVADD